MPGGLSGSRTAGSGLEPEATGHEHRDCTLVVEGVPKSPVGVSSSAVGRTLGHSGAGVGPGVLTAEDTRSPLPASDSTSGRINT